MVGKPVTPEPVENPPVDFGMAEHFMRVARVAREAGNTAEFVAARHMVMVALGLDSKR